MNLPLSPARNRFRRFVALAALTAAWSSLLSLSATAALLIHEVPDPAYRASDQFTVTVNGQKMRTYSAKVSVQEVFRGRATGLPNDNVEIAFASLDADEPLDFLVKVNAYPVTSAAVKPSSLGVPVKVAGQEIAFRVERPGSYVLQCNGDPYKLLHLFVNPPAPPPRKDDRDTVVLPAGIHQRIITLDRNGQQIYLAPGAVLRGRIVVSPGVRSVRIWGRGFIDGSDFTLAQGGQNLIQARRADGLRVEGVTLLDAQTWNIRVMETKGATIENVKIISFRQNSDGIDPCSSEDVTIDRCFIRNSDDCIVIKLERGSSMISRNIAVRRSIVTTDHGAALKVGNNELLGSAVTDVTFEDCDVLFCRGASLAVMNSGTAAVSRVVFQDIRVEDSRSAVQLSRWQGIEPAPIWAYGLIGSRNAYLKEYVPGTVRDVLFRNIRVFGQANSTVTPKVVIINRSAEHNVDNLRFENVEVNGVRLTELNRDNSVTDAFTRTVSFAPGREKP